MKTPICTKIVNNDSIAYVEVYSHGWREETKVFDIGVFFHNDDIALMKVTDKKLYELYDGGEL